MKKNYPISKLNPKVKRQSIFSGLILIVLFLFTYSSGIAQTQGPLNAGTGTSGGGTNVAWTNPGRITANDLLYTTSTMSPGQITRVLTGTNYGFSIPATATINGIAVSIMRQSDQNGGGNSINDTTVRLLKAGVAVGTNNAVGTDWPVTMAAANYGGPTNLWGTTWLPADINAGNFGVALVAATQAVSSNRTASVDYIQITVYYTSSPTITSFSPVSACAGTTPSVTITGTNFTSPASVTFNGVAGTTPVVVSSTQITVNLPSTATTGQIVVTTPLGTPNTSLLTPSNFTIYPYPTVAAITGSAAICPGTSVTLSCATPGGVWNSLQPAIATVSAGGVVTGIANAGGTATITYTVTTNGCATTQSTTVLVNPKPVVSGPTSVCVGSTIDFTPSTGGTWVSSNPTAASIDNTGHVIALAGGTAFFTFTNSTTGCIASTSATPTTVNTLPTTSNPVSISRCTGTTATFSVTAGGSGITYKWYKDTNPTPIANGGNITGATTNTLSISALTLANAGNYHCEVTGTCAPIAVSADATLTVNQAVSITGQPAVTQSICAGSAAIFTTTATGAITTYEWYKVGNATPLADGGNISGATTFQLTLSAITAADAGSYFCIVIATGPCANVMSNNSALIVNALPSITTQPSPQMVCSGGTTSFSVTAGGTGITYKWYFGATLLNNGANISGATTNTITLSSIALAAAGNYHCEISGTCLPTVISNDALLTVVEAISITAQPAVSQSLCTGSNATFTVTAIGAVSTYEWYKVGNATPLSDGGNISGATTFQLTLSSLILTDAGNYYCIVKGTSPCGNVTSNNSTLIVNDGPAITANPTATQTVCAGGSVSFSVTASGGSLLYQWYKGATPLSNTGSYSGTATATLTINPTTAADAATDYYCMVSNGCVTPATSNNAALVVNENPFIFNYTRTICSEDTFTVNPVSGSPTLATIVPANTTYTWAAPVVTGGITGGSAGSAQTQISQTLTNPTNTLQTATYTVFPTSGTIGSCAGASFTITVSVNPRPFINNISSGSCSGQTLTITPTNGSGNIIPAGTTYSWGIPVVTGGMTGGSAGSGISISLNLINPTNVLQTANYTVTATSGTCVGSTFSIGIKIDPKPTVAGSPSTLSPICSGSSIGSITLSNPNNVAGTIDYQWTRSNTANLTGIAASGNTSTITGNLTNTTNSPQTAVFTLSAISDQGCISDPVTVSIVVNPIPTVAALPATQTICSGNAATINITNPNAVSGTVLSWTRDNTVSLSGIPNGSGPTISGSLINNTVTPQTTTFTITATANGCSSVINTITVLVNPRPDVDATPNTTQTLCGGIVFPGFTITNPNGIPGTTFSWTRNNTGVVTGFPNSGTGATIASGTFTNTTNVNQTTRFTITASNLGCPSTTLNVDIIVKPAPLVVASVASQNICHNAAMAAINLSTSNNYVGTTYTWTRDNTANVGTMASSGSGNTISGTLTNSTTTTQTTTFTIVATAPNGCTKTINATVSVYAPLTASIIGTDQTVCVLSQPDILSITTATTGGSGVYTYQWQSCPNPTAPTPVWTNVGTGTTYQPGFIGFGGNNTYYRLIVTNICGSITSSNIILIQVVNSVGFTFGGVNNPATQCPGGTFTTNIDSDHATTSAVRYSWTADSNYISPATGSLAGTTGPIQSFFFLQWRNSAANLPFTVQNNGPTTITTQISILPTVYDYPGPPSGALQCSITPQIVTVIIRPKPQPTVNVPNPTICSGTATGIQLTSNITDNSTTYNWTRNNGAVASGNVWGAVSGTGSGSNTTPYTIATTLTNNTTSDQNVVFTITPTSLGCPGTAITVTITVAPKLTPGAIASSQTTICSGSSAVFTNQTAGSPLSYQWQSSTDGTNYADISGATGATYTTVALTQNTYFRRAISVTSGVVTCQAWTTPILITINNITAGSITGDTTLCTGGNPGILGSTATGSVNATGSGTISYEWESSTVGCSGPWTPISGAVLATYSPGALSATTYYHRRGKSIFNGVTCYSPYSNCVTVTVNVVSPGTVGSDQYVCGTNPSAFTEITPASALGTLTYQWQISSDNVSFSNIAFAIGATYDPPAGVTAVTYYRRITTSTLNSVACAAAPSNVITITPNTVSAGTIGVNKTVCYGGNPSAFTSTTAGTGTGLTYQWEMSTVSSAGPWTPISGAVADSYDEPGPINQTTYYQRVATATIFGNSCSVASNFVTVFVNDVTASVINGDQTVCGMEDPTAFTIGTAATGNGVLSYQWQSNTTGCGGAWTNITGATAATYDPPVPTQTIYYHVVVTSSLNSVLCTAISNCITVTSNSRVWTGLIDADWYNNGNWTGNSVPTASHCVVIPNVVPRPVITGGSTLAYAYNLTILNGGVLQIDPTNSLTVTDVINVNPGGQFNIKDDADLIQINNGNNTGIINVERITPPIYRFDYTYWGSPVTLASNFRLGGVGGLSPNTQPDKYYSWTPTNGGSFGSWAQESAATIMDPRKGYIIRAPQTYSADVNTKIPYTANFIGTPNNGDILCPVYFGTLPLANNNDKYNLLGNPYPSGVDADKFVNDPANTPIIDGTLYFWTHNSPPSASYVDPFYGDFVINYTATDYATWNILGATAATTGGVAPGGFIASGQGFFTKSTGTATSGDPVIFKNTMRTPGKNSQFFRSANRTSDTFEKHRIWLNLINHSGAFNQILIGYAEGATLGWDRNFDGVRISDVGVTLYSVIPDHNLVIQGRPLPFDTEDRVPLGFKAAVQDTYALRIDHLDGLFDSQNVYVEDKLLNIIHDLKQSPYEFTSAIGTFNDRLVLRYTDTFLSVTNPSLEAGLTAFIIDEKLRIQSSEDIRRIYVYDLTGKLIRSYIPETQDKNFEGGFVFAEGVYMVKIKLQDGSVITKKLINSK